MSTFLSTKRKGLSLHKAVQDHVLFLLPPGEGFLEHPFPGHFADVAWPKKQLIFEIQCSSIAIKEIEKRTRDYASFGYRVVWILHQKEFNKRLLSPAERYLRTRECAYFTNVTATGQGYIYDQTETLQGLLRTHRSAPFPIDICRPLTPSTQKKKFNFLRLYDTLLLKIVQALNG